MIGRPCDEVVVVYSRARERANLAMQLFNDAGLHRCGTTFVYVQYKLIVNAVVDPLG